MGKNTLIRKLFAKPSGIAAATIIVLTAFVAVFAYILAPDKSPNANRMIVELAAKPMGFEKEFLLVPKNTFAAKEGFWTRFWSGLADNYNYVPVNSYHISGDSLYVQHYIDEGLYDTLNYPLALFQKEENKLSKKALIADVKQNHIRKLTFHLGTDRYGRDILSRLLVGARVSMAVGMVAVLLSLSIGVILGAFAGYFGSWVDNTIMWLINILWAIPTLLLVFAITLSIGKGFWEIFIAIGLTMWVGTARLIRGQTLSLKEMDYITAAKAMGSSDFRIIFRHILPNILGPVIVLAVSNFSAAILIEAGLSFLGVGVQPPQPSWGLMIKEHYNFLVTNSPLLAIIPGLAIMLLVFAFNILGNRLRDILDVRS